MQRREFLQRSLFAAASVSGLRLAVPESVVAGVPHQTAKTAETIIEPFELGLGRDLVRMLLSHGIHELLGRIPVLREQLRQEATQIEMPLLRIRDHARIDGWSMFVLVHGQVEIGGKILPHGRTIEGSIPILLNAVELAARRHFRVTHPQPTDELLTVEEIEALMRAAHPGDVTG